MRNTESNTWPPSILSMLGERQMQKILSLKIQSLGVEALAQLKRRFKYNVPPSVQHFITAQERYTKLRGLEIAFTDDEKRLLLSLFVPEDLPPEVIVNELWHKRKPCTINDVFRSRFEHTSIPYLRAFIDGRDPHHIPDGMVLAERVVGIYEGSLEAAESQLAIGKKKARARRNKIVRIKKNIEATYRNRLDGGVWVITNSIEQLLGRKATRLFHDGCSTYAEPSRMGWKGIAECLTVKPMTSEDIILDLGSGSAATLWQLCQYHGCRGIGIEYGEARLRSAAQCSVELLRKHGDNPAFNTNVINCHDNIMRLGALPPCSVLYIYDEAFPESLMAKICELIDDAPSRLRYVISFKANKFHEYRSRMNALRGFRAISLGNRINKAFSQEGSQYDLYERRVRDEGVSSTSLGTEAQPFENYWNGGIEAKIKYYVDLHDDMDRVLNDQRASRARRHMQEA